MKNVKFYIGDMQEFIKKYPLFNQLHVYESSNSEAAGFKKIDTLKEFQPTKDYIEVNVSDDYFNRWYKFAYASTIDAFPENETEKLYGYSDITFPEVIGTVILELRDFLGDTSEEETKQAFTDREYMKMLRSALVQFKGDESFSEIHERDFIPLKILVQIDCAMEIAYNHAKYYALESPGAKLDKSQIMDHYLRVASQLNENYDKISSRTNRGAGGYNDQKIITQMPGVKVVDALRYSSVSGRFVKLQDRFNFRNINRQQGL